jgi:hypothetical protein
MRPEEQEFRGRLGRPILQIFIFYAAIWKVKLGGKACLNLYSELFI